MVESWQCIIKLIVILMYAVREIDTNTPDWRYLESMAEELPHIVAILDRMRAAVCTGVVVSEQAVLTSGRCANSSLTYVAVGLAVIGRHNNDNNIFVISHAVAHEDYVFSLTPDEPDLTHMHNNIGLIFTKKPFIDIFFGQADIGNYYALELKEQRFDVFGYGKLKESDVYVLQRQQYHQSPCLNPKWYYCVCGFEYVTSAPMDTEEFGEGAPVIVGKEVAAIAAVPCGRLAVPISGVRYNIFTIISPYRAWLDKTKPKFRTHLTNPKRSTSNYGKHESIMYICILLLISKLLV